MERRAARRLVDMHQRIRDLQGIEQELRKLIAGCPKNPVKESCPIFHVLEQGR
jgi:hypothetical protein